MTRIEPFASIALFFKTYKAKAYKGRKSSKFLTAGPWVKRFQKKGYQASECEHTLNNGILKLEISPQNKLDFWRYI